MTLEMLQKDMIIAMKVGDKTRKDVLSTLVSNVKKTAIDEQTRDNITEELVNRVILKEVKIVKEQIDTCPDSRVDLKDIYKIRYAILEEYAPRMLSESEVFDIISIKFADVLKTKNKGLIMKSVMSELKGKADGNVINKCVTALIASV